MTAGLVIPPLSYMGDDSLDSTNLFFDISLAQWSLNSVLFSGELDHLDFPAMAKNEFDIDAVEYVNRFFSDHVADSNYLGEMNSRCRDLGVKQLLIMVDGEGELAAQDDSTRKQAVENHYKWVEAAEILGCHSIRVNLNGEGGPEELGTAAVNGLGQLTEFASDYNIAIIVENHGGYSSDASWLADVIRQVDLPNCGTLPDFGNFCLRRQNGECVEEYDRYRGVEELMPYAKAVSAKSFAFDEQGGETTIDFKRMLKIIKEAGYNGYIGIEYEGRNLSKSEGITATKNLLISAGKEISTK